MLRSLAYLSNKDNRLIEIKVFDKYNLSSIQKAIQSEFKELHISNNNSSIYVRYPQLTKEYRLELWAKAKNICEKYKIAVRTERKVMIDAARSLQSKDFQEKELKAIQALIDRAIKKINDALLSKQKGLLI